MEIIIDSSVAVSVLRGGQNCMDCLEIIRHNDSYKIISCGSWADHWNHAISNAIPVTPVHRDFLLSWNQAMTRRRKLSSSTTHPCIAIIQSDCEKCDENRLYLLAIALNTGCLVLYCSLLSSTCARLSAIEHPDIVKIQDQWKKSELTETVQWLRDHA